MNDFGIVIVSHVYELAEGLSKLLSEIVSDVCITFSGGTDNGGIGTSFDSVEKAVSENKAENVLCFYDIGSSKMILETVAELSDKTIHLYDTALVESAFTAATLIGAGASLEEIESQLEPLSIK